MVSGNTSIRAPRSTRIRLARAEVHQSLVISALTETGQHDIARRQTRCQHERQNRQGGWPWRCRSAGCWACRRTAIRAWWRAFRIWLSGSETSLAVIPLPGNSIIAIRKLRKGLRDVRDRTARHDPRWGAVVLAGFASEGLALVLISHASIDRANLWWTLSGRWPMTVVTDVGDAESSSSMHVDEAAALARYHRGIEPLRIVILPQIAAVNDEWAEPMPMVV